jgi:hypothetical protein
MGASIFRLEADGVGPLAEAFAVPAGAQYRVVSATLHLNAAAVTAENFTITLDAAPGAAYDTLLNAVDLSVGAIVNLLWQPDEELYLFGGDALDVNWANTDGRTWGLLVTMEAK